MRWTTDAPTTAGWYWTRYAQYGAAPASLPRCVLVHWASGSRTAPGGPSDALACERRALAAMETSEWSDAAIPEPVS